MLSLAEIEFSVKKALGLMDGEKLQGSVESSGMKNSSFVANMQTFISIIGMFLIFVAVLIVLSLCGSCIRELARGELAKLKKKMFFAGKIKAQTVGYLQVLISF